MRIAYDVRNLLDPAVGGAGVREERFRKALADHAGQVGRVRADVEGKRSVVGSVPNNCRTNVVFPAPVVPTS